MDNVGMLSPANQRQLQQQQQQQQRGVMPLTHSSPGGQHPGSTSPYQQQSSSMSFGQQQQLQLQQRHQISKAVLSVSGEHDLSTSRNGQEESRAMHSSNGGGGHDQLVTELMHEVESKRSELENMTMSVVQWKQNFKDKLKQEKNEIQRDKERTEATIMQRLDTLQEKASVRMLALHDKTSMAVAFQKLRENRKQVLWLQRVKDLKAQCEVLKEELTIASNNAHSASVEFSQDDFVKRMLVSLSNLMAYVQGPVIEVEGQWLMADIAGVGNAVVGDKIKQLMGVLQQLKAAERHHYQRASDLALGNAAIVGLHQKVDALEGELAAKRKAVEVLSMQLDMEVSNTPLRGGAGAGSGGGAQVGALQRELQTLSEVKVTLEEENVLLRQQRDDVEESNNALRSQLAAARRDQDGHAQQAADETLITTLTEMREAAERNALKLSEELTRQRGENTSLREMLEDARRRDRPASEHAQPGNDLLQLIQLRAAADKRAEEAEAVLKQEQHAVWKLKSEIKLLESRLGEGGRASFQSSGNSPKLQPRDSQSSVLSGHSTSPTSSEAQLLRRELRVMNELKDAALQSLDSMRCEMVDGVTNIEFSNLRVDSKIGSGSFAEVYRGEWTRPCAIKKLRGLTRRRQLQDFYREGQILQMIHHPGVVRLMGICMNIPELYLITELVVGGSLEDLLHIEKRLLGQSDLLSIAIQIADAMQFLHLANVVHRDLKPSNCLIDQNGVVKLCDFGLARVMGKEPSQTSESSRAGTPVYLAPEALQGAATTHKVDVYSYGVICWEMMTGLQAWVALDYKQMVNAVLRDRKRPPHPPEGSKEWRSLIDACWGHEPDERPSFSAVVVSLQDMGAPRPVRQAKTTPFKNVELV